MILMITIVLCALEDMLYDARGVNAHSSSHRTHTICLNFIFPSEVLAPGGGVSY